MFGKNRFNIVILRCEEINVISLIIYEFRGL